MGPASFHRDHSSFSEVKDMAGKKKIRNKSDGENSGEGEVKTPKSKRHEKVWTNPKD